MNEERYFVFELDAVIALGSASGLTKVEAEEVLNNFPEDGEGFNLIVIKGTTVPATRRTRFEIEGAA